MVEITYIGPHDSVLVIAGPLEAEVGRGETISVPEEEAEGLLAQETNWQRAKQRRKKEGED